MPFSPADSRIFAPLFGDPATAAIFSDEQFARYMLDVEAALARVEARLGVIPAEAAQRIAAASQSLAVDFERLRDGTEQDGFPVVELVRQLRAGAGGEAAGYVHWGATTQDIMDTALVLQLRAALGGLEENLAQVIGSLAGLADRHRRTLLAGRTHSQQALPITFGLKVANWLAPLLRHRQRLGEIKPRLLVIQFGGAAGTLAALSDAGLAVQAALAAELGLGVLPMPWHTQRDNLAEFAGWLSLVSGSLAKMAQDVILLAQSEIAELREAGGPRGGSSTMPQKNNPVTSEFIVAAARANAALLASMHQALLQENERATGAWQIEWLTLPQMLGLTAGALKKARFLTENLVVDAARMAANVRASNGLMLAEGLSFLLAPALGREAAKELVRQAAQTARSEGRRLEDVLREMAGAAADWPSLQDEADYLGAAEAFIDRVLRAAAG
jgi:3-carboxy-cis,cis-muconate cycloisomerase